MRILLPLILLCLITGVELQGQPSDLPSADEIVKRAISRRAENERSAGSLTASIHTSSTIEVRRGNSLVALIPEQTVMLESAGAYARDREFGTRIRIHARRGTELAAGPARSLIENVQSLGEYFSIEEDEIVLLNTSFMSPLAEDAGRLYDYRLAGRSTRGGGGLYEIDLVPTTRLYPAFTGKLYIAEGSYDLVEADLRPSEKSAIPFVRDLHLVQKFSRVDGGAYQPESLELTGLARVRAVAFGVAEPEMEFAITSRLSKRQLNGTIPDSLRLQPQRIVVLDDADGAPATFWERDGRLEPERARAMERLPRGGTPGRFTVSAAPYIDYNRAGAASLGASGNMAFGPLTVGGMGGYSFGLDRTIGEASVMMTIGSEDAIQVTPRASAFSRIEPTTTGDRSYPRIMNTLVAASLHQDYYDFYRKDGWNAGADIIYDPVRLAVTFEQSQQFSIGNNARWSILTWQGKEFQENPPITDGSYQTIQADLSWGRVAPFLKITPVGNIDIRWSLTGLLGNARASETSFRLAEALLSLSIPVAHTGYAPVTLTLLGAGGMGTATLPPQYQFRLRTSAATFGKPGGLVSPPKGFYGGTEYLALGAEINLTDLWWRAMGLPTYNGRGVELLVAGAGAHYSQHHPVGYVGMGDRWYTEAGIGLSRIPLFLTDLIAGRVDLRWGFGELGRFGGNFTFVVPL